MKWSIKISFTTKNTNIIPNRWWFSFIEVRVKWHAWQKTKCKSNSVASNKKLLCQVMLYICMRAFSYGVNEQETTSCTIISMECHHWHANVREWAAYCVKDLYFSLFLFNCFCCQFVFFSRLCECAVSLLWILIFKYLSYSIILVCFENETKQRKEKKTTTWHNPFGMCEYYNRMICNATFCLSACVCVYDVRICVCLLISGLLSELTFVYANAHPHTLAHTYSFRSID